MTTEWTPESWRSYEARQQPLYPEPTALDAAVEELSSYPPLIRPAEARLLKHAIAEAQTGQAFLLQGGDCAESFAEFSIQNIDASFSLIRSMSEVIGQASRLPIIGVGRMAGQFAKPRSKDFEVKNGTSVPVYRGDIINGIAFDPAAREPDPQRLFRAYAQAYATLARIEELGGSSLFTSHEALLLPWEQALTREDRETGASFATSAHLLWIGDRTRFVGSAHVEFARGIANPLGIKCGPTLTPDLLIALLETLNPAREKGRITLVSRMGAETIEESLPRLLRAAAREGHPVLWTCDPMHGNTIKASNGYKTRPVSRILDEVRSFFAVAAAEGVWPGGIHIEMTGQNVTECTGGPAELTEQDLEDRYHTHCDPRLNPHQAMELACLVAELMTHSNSKAA